MFRRFILTVFLLISCPFSSILLAQSEPIIEKTPLKVGVVGYPPFSDYNEETSNTPVGKPILGMPQQIPNSYSPFGINTLCSSICSEECANDIDEEIPKGCCVSNN